MKNRGLLIPFIVIAAGSFLLGRMFDLKLSISRRPFLTRLLGPAPSPTPAPSQAADDSAIIGQVTPSSGIELPVTWGDLGIRLVKAGVIDAAKFTPNPDSPLLTAADNGRLTVSQENSRLLLNLLWALGLGNKNAILEEGPMTKKEYGGAGNFASTGGWTLARGDAMSHYSKHGFIKLTPDQQKLVERVSQNIYRPCCGNATYFPDCNHGMAMLALLELMAAQGVGESDMYKYALAVNSYWFPDTYLTIGKYKASQGIPWSRVDPQEILGADYSSAAGYRRVSALVDPVSGSGGGGCGV